MISWLLPITSRFESNFLKNCTKLIQKKRHMLMKCNNISAFGGIELKSLKNPTISPKK